MLLRILGESLHRRKKRLALGILAVLIGSSLATLLFTVSSEIVDKMTREMRSYGANILVTPQSDTAHTKAAGSASIGGEGYVDEGELVKLKTIFWRNNILGFAPYLTFIATIGKERVALTGTWFEKSLTLPKGTTVRTGLSDKSAVSEAVSFTTGVKDISPWWRVQGQWVADGDEEGAILGSTVSQGLGLHVGDPFTVRYGDRSEMLVVRGIVTTGGFEDNQIYVNLPVAQRLTGISRGASMVLVSALTLPKEKLAPDIRSKKPEEMSPAEYEKWYCSPIIEAVATQIQEVIPGAKAKPIRQISESEGSFVTKIQWLMVLMTVVALLVSVLGVMTTMTAFVLERKGEIGLMKAIGAENFQIGLIFLSEGAVMGLLGGILGYGMGAALSGFLGFQVFGIPLFPNPNVLPISVLLALTVVLVGSIVPVRRAMRIEPITLLRAL